MSKRQTEDAPRRAGAFIRRGTPTEAVFSALFPALTQLLQQGPGFGIVPFGRALQPEGGLRGIGGNAVAPQQAQAVIAHAVRFSLFGGLAVPGGGFRGIGGCSLRGASLQRADLFEASLREARLHAADVRNANLYGADLYRLGMDDATRLDGAHIARTILAARGKTA